MSRKDTVDSDETPRDGPLRSNSAEAEQSPIVYEIAVPTAEFGLEEALREFPDVVVESERLVPTNQEPIPYLWTNDGEIPAFQEAIADDPKVERIRKSATFDDGALYKIGWRHVDGELLDWAKSAEEQVALLEAVGQDDEWQLKFRLPSRATLAEFREFQEAHDIDTRIVRLYDLTEPKMGQYDISEKQREALVRALEMGHFEIPRQATLEEVAETLGITAKSVSERLRRGQANLVSNALTIGRPASIGL
jgi:hypothetical protein